MTQKRGRWSRDDQVGLVIHLFRQDLFVLEDDEGFADCRGVQSLMRQLQRETLKRGTALELLIQGAVIDVLAELCSSETPQAQRLAQFLHLWFQDRKSIIQIAALLHLDRSYVGRAMKDPALTLVAQRFLRLTQHEDPAEESQGVREARHLHEQRRLRATERFAIRRGSQGDVWNPQEVLNRHNVMHSPNATTTS